MSITNMSKKIGIVLAVVLFAFAGNTVAFAADLDGGGFDYGYGSDSYDYGYDYGYGSDGYDYGYGADSYDYGYGTDGYDYGYGTDSNDYGYGTDGYDYGYGANEFFPDTEFYPDSEFYADGEFYPDGAYGCGYDCDGNGYYDSRDSYYYDEGCACYSYGSYGGGVTGRSASYGYSSGGYSMVKPMTFGSPSYPTYSQPAKSTGGSSSVSNISNTTITNVDNSIKDSFNNYNSNNVSYVVPATPQYPVVNVQPAPYCQIYQTQATGSGVTAVYLSWTSSNATSAYLSNVGGVSVNGSKTVWPTGNQNYTLTVYGYNGQTATCHTNVNTAPYVSLSQIPYTGFDFGTFGNAMYWAGLATFALGAGYLAIYYVPALALAGARSRKEFAPVVAPKAPILVEREAALGRNAMGEADEKLAPIVNSIRKAGTFDTMAILASKDGSMPKIVIARE